ncbi:alpha/beta hydrolase fold domain-containing protein [Ochrobactrum chromiisoli]|uniref:Alpha/beta hydrolase n=1 Tax=Ochrobactrum chromiisoli TaxID=2993941 RepID=A0ABT3QLI4_9HYPH|nr:alpha/beta hydrolase [Ochrobactrum chromiisoli]MCX2696473.1 alpha/beta hydrolase [Ochrobactrum chromiisoli]
MSLSQTIARWLLSFKRNNFRTEGILRDCVQKMGTQQIPDIPSALRSICDVSETWLQDQKIIQLTPREKRSGDHIIYIHGGAYVHELVSAHWSIILQLVKHTGATVTLPLYALAPQHDHVKATAMMDALYDRIAASREQKRIFVAGDSAGGNFALSLALRRRDAGKSVPDGLILYSPWLDLELKADGIRDIEPKDVMLGVDGLRICGQWWAGSADPGSEYFSMVNSDPEGLPPLAIFQGDRDLFVVDARHFAKLCQSRGVDALYREYPGAFHVFMGATFTPEARDVFSETKNFVERTKTPL